MHKQVIVVIFVSIVVFVKLGVSAGGLKEGIRYRIRSGYDGNMLTAQYPTYAKNLSLNLGDVTVEEWYQGLNQLWILHNRSVDTVKPQLYWMKPMKAVLNSLTGIPMEKEVKLEVKEITENSGTFTIRNPIHNLCLENQGIGLQTVYRACNELNTAQQWDFEDPHNLKFYVRLFNQLLGMFN